MTCKFITPPSIREAGGQNGPMPRVSVIVVSFNTREALRRCLSAVRAERVHETIVIDNASTDGSPEMVEREFPEVRLIRNSANRGFGAANNQGLDAMTGDLALFLNSDASPRPGAIARLARCFEDPEVVAAGGKLVFPDGRLQESAAGPLTLWALFCEQTGLEKLFPRSRWLSPYWLSRRLVESGRPGPHAVAQVMGACLMIRPVARFDERFFLYCEDTELCRRLAERGKIVYEPEAVFEHELGASSRADRWRAIRRYNRGKELYFRIHHGLGSAVAAYLLNRAGLVLRAGLWGSLALVTLGQVRSFRERALLFARALGARDRS